MTATDCSATAQGPARDNADCRAALLITLILALGIAGLRHLPLALAVLLALLAWALWRMRGGGLGARLRQLAHRLAHVEGFVLLLLVMLPLTTPGRALAQIGPLAISAEGLGLALLLAAKINAMALVILLIPGQIAPQYLGRSLTALGLGRRFVLLAELMLRHLHSARQGLARQHEAMRARAFRPGLRLQAFRAWGQLFGGALLRAFDRAARLDEAMRLRGGHVLAHAALPPLAGRARLAIAAALILALGVTALDRLS